MRKIVILLTCIVFAMPFGVAQEIPSKDWQIKTALMAVPQDYQDGAKVYGYDANGNFMTLQEGTNDYIALADNPGDEKFSTAAYHKDLEPFMARGRELKAQGKEFKEIFDIRENEVKSGKLKMPDKATLCVFTGTVNKETKEIENPYVRYVFYIPFATGASTGLPTTPTPPGHAWLMDPGTHRAHIMITPPKN
ncbi:hypothetical protein [Flagellimonas allohymeniacidonis]|uniref:Uncharacterized protein n=1 Tax=Flagellimonas allohymeniacidonis TaxID=2517819 RepID=A0A4Q8QIZ7_9FLAO|nr:hypothetical protein [Allomuricauda hymeniacidonis]TAI48693.1 hypothetical protein EW142_02520 [Allomuricauda hymeniacidonis]